MSIETQIHQKLTSAFHPVFIEVVNESYKHNVPEGSESHFKVLLVSNVFENVSRLERHRKINTVLAEELSGPVHALALRVLTPTEWEKSSEFKSPDCKGGSR